jgi:hypothetical protein
MRSICLIAIILLSVSNRLAAQAFTDSNLPIVIIDTEGGATIPDEPKIPATMKIIYRGEGERNYMSDQDNPEYLNYDGKIDIETRGSSSQYSSKKQYGFTTRKEDGITNNNVSLLGIPSENDWILNSMVFDSALVRDYLCFNLSRQLGEYASRTVYCEVVINRDYRGLYLLEEKIKVDKNRVDIVKIDEYDINYPDFTGGYITKADKTTGGDPVAWLMNDFYGNGVAFIHEHPKPEEVKLQQNTYIREYFFSVDSKIYTKYISPAEGYPSVIDIPSFINYMIVSELASNADSYQFSTFFHKDRNGKLRAGPVWDSDLTFGNDLYFWGFDRSKPNVWQLSNGDNEGARFWRNLFYESHYKCYLSKRWNELIQPGQPLNPETLDNFIDQTVARISEAIVRENARWNNVGDHAERISVIKYYLEERIPWITDSVGSYSECSNVEVPPLVISKIMYHPDTTIVYSEYDNDDREFIEITNNGDQEVDLTGIYFMGTGLVYQFPAESKIDAGEKIFLAGKSSVFKTIYGILPFGEFTRSLSNKSERILIGDCFGNVIDDVTYCDTLPWPNADGNGYYLELIDPDMDNSIGANWVTASANDLSVEDIYTSYNLKVYPNPVSDYLNIESTNEILSVSLFNLTGSMILPEEQVNAANYRINMADLPAGFYLLRVKMARGTVTYRVIKI